MSKLTWVQTRISCFKALMREYFFFFKSVLLITLLIQMRSGTFQKRKPFICAGTAELVWRASLCFPYHEKVAEIQGIMALIWSRWGGGLSSVNCWPYQFYISRVFHHFHQCDELDNYYFAICTHGPNCENGGVTWLAAEKLSIIAWKVFTPWLAENISMKYSPDSEQ